MFKFLKEKLKNAISKTSEKIEEEGETIEQEIEVPVEETKEEVKEESHPQEEKEEKKGFFAKIKERFSKKEEEETPEEKEIGKSEKTEEKTKEELAKEQEDKEEPEELPEEKQEAKEKVQEEEKTETAQEKKEEIKKAVEEKEEEKLEKEEQEIIQEEKKIIEEEIKAEKETEEKKEKESPQEQEVEEAIKEEKEKQLETERIEQEQKIEEVEKKKEGFLSKIKEKFVTKKISYNQFEDIFYEFEIILLENNVAVEVIDKIKSDLSDKLVEKPIRRNRIEETIRLSLKESIEELLDVESKDLLKLVKRNIEKPFVITFLGINGSGKTTTIAKIAEMFQKNNKKVVLAAADTFRAAAIDQLGIHADKLGIKLIKHDYGSDPAAVAFDAIKHAKAKDVDVVLVDTAGRIHSNSNLMEEMKKIIRVAKPDFKIFVGEAITGNDCTEQAKKFDEAVGIDGIILTKSDVDEKGGAAISASYVTKKPVLYLGIGQEYADIKEFDSSVIIESLGLIS